MASRSWGRRVLLLVSRLLFLRDNSYLIWLGILLPHLVRLCPGDFAVGRLIAGLLDSKLGDGRSTRAWRGRLSIGKVVLRLR